MPVTCRLVLFCLGLLPVCRWPSTADAQVASAARQSGAVKAASEVEVLSSGYIRGVFSRADLNLVELRTDPSGNARYSQNLLGEGGLRFEAASRHDLTADQKRSFKITGPADHPRLEMHWTGACGPADVIAELTPAGTGIHLTATSSAGPFDLRLRQSMIVGEFEQGTVQYVGGQVTRFPAASPLKRVYTIDRLNGSVAFLPDEESPIAESELVSDRDPQNVAFHFGAPLAGVPAGAWQPLAAAARSNGCSQPLTYAFTIMASRQAFPGFAAPPFGASTSASADSDAYRVATYATAAAVLGSFQEPGSAYPTLAIPKRAYGDSFDFFDPDSWPVVASLSYSGDPVLQREARSILERSLAGMLPDGQIPHHFESGKPVYLSIAQSRQTGPNLFWVLAAAEYASATGDDAWLRTHYASMRQATEWILRSLDSKIGLVHADGPLFIDVFRRSGFTLDTNALALHLLRIMEETATSQEDRSSADQYRQAAATLRLGLVRTLWDGHDHFITERHRDGTVRDFVDTDGNFAALAFDVLPDAAQRRALLHRLDSNPHLHPGGFGTWVSERRYDKSECYGGNDGDSDVTMGRIWWLEELARIKMKDLTTFDATLDRLRGDLLDNTWLYERYDKAGHPTHNPYYHEYPEILSMVLREMRYGVRLSPSTVVVEPFGPSRFTASFGLTRVDYSQDRVTILVPGSLHKTYIIGGLRANAAYRTSDGNMLHAGADGRVTFNGVAGVLVTLKRVAGSTHGAEAAR